MSDTKLCFGSIFNSLKTDSGANGSLILLRMSDLKFVLICERRKEQEPQSKSIIKGVNLEQTNREDVDHNMKYQHMS